MYVVEAGSPTSLNRNVSAGSTATDFHRSLLPARVRSTRYELSAPASVHSRRVPLVVTDPDSWGTTSVELEFAPCRLSAMTPVASIRARVNRGIFMTSFLQSLVWPSPLYRLCRKHFLTGLVQIECLSRARVGRGFDSRAPLTERRWKAGRRSRSCASGGRDGLGLALTALVLVHPLVGGVDQLFERHGPPGGQCGETDGE